MTDPGPPAPARPDPMTMLVMSVIGSVVATLVLIFVFSYLRAHLRWVSDPASPAGPVKPVNPVNPDTPKPAFPSTLIVPSDKWLVTS